MSDDLVWAATPAGTWTPSDDLPPPPRFDAVGLDELLGVAHEALLALIEGRPDDPALRRAVEALPHLVAEVARLRRIPDPAT